MKATGLQIGNWLYCTPFACCVQIKGITEFGGVVAIHFDHKDSGQALLINHFEAMALSPEVLCNNSNFVVEGGMYQYDRFFITQGDAPNKFRFAWGKIALKAGYQMTEFDSVHELQNLHYSLTGKDISFNF